MAGFSVLLTVALAAPGPGQTEFVGDLPLVMVPRTSGLSVPIIALSSTMKFFLPLAVSLFAGESVAGEAAGAVFATCMARPVSRSPRSLVEGHGGRRALALAVVMLAVAAVVVGGLTFGWHPLSVIDGSSVDSGSPARWWSTLVPCSATWVSPHSTWAPV